MLPRVYQIARLVAASSGREALRRGLPLYLTVAIGSFVVFAGNGLNASSIVKLANGSIGLRVALLAVWLIAALPVASALIQNRRVLFLKALPVPTREILAVLATLLGIAHLPWILLWARGATPMAAVQATLSALALHALWLARPWRVHTALLFASTIGLWLWAPSALTCAGALLAFALGLQSAWERGPRPTGEQRVWPTRAPATLALSVAYLATLWRAHSAIIVRCLYLCLSGSLVTFFLLRNNTIVPFSSRAELAEALFVPLASVPLAGLAGPLLRTEREADWVLAICNVPAGRLRHATATTLAAVAVLLAVPYCGVLAVGLQLGLGASARLLAEHSILAASLACVAESIARHAIQDRGRDGMRLIFGMGSLAVLAIMSLLAAGRTVALVGWPLVAGALVLLRVLASRTNIASSS